MWFPCPDFAPFAPPETKENVTEATDGSSRGDEEIELRASVRVLGDLCGRLE